MTDLPKSLRVGPHDIRITLLEGEAAEENYGSFTESNLEIELRKAYLAGSLAVDSALHELIHAIWFVGSIKAEYGEEHIASVLATHLAQVFRDNPDFMKWLQATVSK